jgi:hypothetical protein
VTKMKWLKCISLALAYLVSHDLHKKLCSDCYWPSFLGANIFPFQFNLMLLKISAVVYDKYSYLNFWNDFSVLLNYTCFLSPSYYVFYDLPKKLCSDCYWPGFVGTNIFPFSVWSHVTRIQCSSLRYIMFFIICWNAFLILLI